MRPRTTGNVTLATFDLTREDHDTTTSAIPTAFCGRCVTTAWTSRSSICVLHVGAYDDLRREMDSLCGAIHGDFGELDWMPVSLYPSQCGSQAATGALSRRSRRAGDSVARRLRWTPIATPGGKSLAPPANEPAGTPWSRQYLIRVVCRFFPVSINPLRKSTACLTLPRLEICPHRNRRARTRPMFRTLGTPETEHGQPQPPGE